MKFARIIETLRLAITLIGLIAALVAVLRGDHSQAHTLLEKLVAVLEFISAGIA